MMRLLLLLPLLVQGIHASTVEKRQLARDPVCIQIEGAISQASDVFYPGDPIYEKGIRHWGFSSTQQSKCVAEPGTASDVGVILGIVGKTRTRFAVKGGGHTANPGFSSTPGVHISMSRFSQITYNQKTQTVVVGAGLVWDDVYAALEPHGVNVVGGRVTGIGVAGFTLGGGYSWKTNQYGLTIDTVTAFELVKPNGKLVKVTQLSDPVLFWGLKGGLNNFGIVTSFTLKTFPQTPVWGGLIIIAGPGIAQVTAATAAFSANVKDPKAEIITSYSYQLGQPIISQLLFYDAPTPPAGIFDAFLAIPFLLRDVQTRSFLSLVQVSPIANPPSQRVIFNSVSLPKYTPTLLQAVLNESLFWGPQLALKDAGATVAYAVEPFLPSIYSHTLIPTAYPPKRSGPLILPFNIYFSWTDPQNDEVFYDAARRSARAVLEAAVSEGLLPSVASAPGVYPNYAIFGTPLESMYGGGVVVLKALKWIVDPANVMGLAGGFRF